MLKVAKKSWKKRLHLTTFPTQKKHKSKRDSVSLPTVEETKQKYTLELPPARMLAGHHQDDMKNVEYIGNPEPTKLTHVFSERASILGVSGGRTSQPLRKTVPSLQDPKSPATRLGGRYTLEDERLEHSNHPFRKENDLPNLYDYVPC